MYYSFLFLDTSGDHIKFYLHIRFPFLVNFDIGLIKLVGNTE